MNYFQLLVGIHYDARTGRSYTAGDIVADEGNLVKAFGSDKFRKLSDKEITSMQIPDAKPKRKKVKRVKRKSA